MDVSENPGLVCTWSLAYSPGSCLAHESHACNRRQTPLFKGTSRPGRGSTIFRITASTPVEARTAHRRSSDRRHGAPRRGRGSRNGEVLCRRSLKFVLFRSPVTAAFTPFDGQAFTLGPAPPALPVARLGLDFQRRVVSSFGSSAAQACLNSGTGNPQSSGARHVNLGGESAFIQDGGRRSIGGFVALSRGTSKLECEPE